MSDESGQSVGGTDHEEIEVSEYSPAEFEAPTPELENGTVVCAGCGERTTADEIGVTADETIEAEDGAVLEVTRVYLHNDTDCMFRYIGADTN